MPRNKSDKEASWILIVEYPSNLDHDKMDNKIDARSGGSVVIKGKTVSNRPSQCWGETIGKIRRLRQSYDEQWKAMEAAKRMEDIKQLTLIDVYDDPGILVNKKVKVVNLMVDKRLVMKGQLFYANEQEGPLFEVYEHNAPHPTKVRYSAKVFSHYHPEGDDERQVIAESELSKSLGMTCRWAAEYREY